LKARLRISHEYDLEKPYVDKTASKAWLKVGKHFTETNGFMIANLDQVTDTNNYKKYIVKVLNTINII